MGAGELNVGQLARERYGADAALAGLTTHAGIRGVNDRQACGKEWSMNPMSWLIGEGSPGGARRHRSFGPGAAGTRIHIHTVTRDDIAG